jgi:hypothetical protein
MRRRVVIVVHPDDDAEEAGEFGHVPAERNRDAADATLKRLDFRPEIDTRLRDVASPSMREP